MRTAAQFVDRLSPLDQVAFRSYPDPGTRVPFTADRLRVKLAMDTLIGHQEDVLATTRLNIGVIEAIAIADRHDEQMLLDVSRRECAIARSPELLEECKRDVGNQASDIAYHARQTAETGLRGLLDLLRELALVDGPKTMILLSEGVAINNAADLDLVAMLAGRARVSLNVLIVDEQRGDISIARTGPTDQADRQRETSGLQNIAAASRGGVFHAVGTAEGVFERSCAKSLPITCWASSSVPATLTTVVIASMWTCSGVASRCDRRRRLRCRLRPGRSGPHRTICSQP